MQLHDVHKGIKKHKKRRRVGRGPGSGWGKTSGRGHKGQGQLAGWSAHPAFEGGQMPLSRRIPKRGFHNRGAKNVLIVNVGDLNDAFKAGDEITPALLQERDLAKGPFDLLKVLGDGDLSKKLKISAHRFSKSALEKIQAAGGEAVVLPGPALVVKNVKKQRKPKAKAGAKN